MRVGLSVKRRITLAKDMTTGSPAKIIGMFALPMLLGNVFQQLYNLVDSVVVGNFVGMEALAAVGAAFPVMFILLALAMGMTIGGSVLLSQLFGAGRRKDMERAMFTMLVMMGVLAVVLTVLGLLFCEPLLRLMNTPENIFADSAAYLRIIFAGLIATFAYNACAALFRAVGDSATPLYFLVLASVLNIGLDLFFVIVLGWGVAGVAAATILAQGISAVLCVVYIIHKVPILRFERENMVFDVKMMKSILRYGVPSSVQQLVVSFSIMAVQGMVNSFGSDVVAGYTAANRVEALAMMPMFNISAALSTFVAQNVGAGKLERVHQGLRATILLSVAICGSIAVGIFLFGEPFINAFVEGTPSPGMLDFGVGYLKVISIFYIINAMYNTLGGLLRGVGDAKTSMIATVIALIVRVASSTLLVNLTDMGTSAIWWGLPISWSVGLLLCLWRYLSGGWKACSATGASAAEAEAGE